MKSDQKTIPANRKKGPAKRMQRCLNLDQEAAGKRSLESGTEEEVGDAKCHGGTDLDGKGTFRMGRKLIRVPGQKVTAQSIPGQEPSDFPARRRCKWLSRKVRMCWRREDSHRAGRCQLLIMRSAAM